MYPRSLVMVFHRSHQQEKVQKTELDSVHLVLVGIGVLREMCYLRTLWIISIVLTAAVRATVDPCQTSILAAVQYLKEVYLA